MVFVFVFVFVFFFFQAEDGIRARLVTGVQTCALPIWASRFGVSVWCITVNVTLEEITFLREISVNLHRD